LVKSETLKGERISDLLTPSDFKDFLLIPCDGGAGEAGIGSPLNAGEIMENIPDRGEHSYIRRTFLIQENIPDTGEHSSYRRTSLI